MRLYEGNILTCDKENRIAHYLLEDQGKILYCGDELPAGCVAAERVSTGEGALIPPFVDSHIHFASYATFHAGLNVMNSSDAPRACEENEGKAGDRVWRIAVFRVRRTSGAQGAAG